MGSGQPVRQPSQFSRNIAVARLDSVSAVMCEMRYLSRSKVCNGVGGQPTTDILAAAIVDDEPIKPLRLLIL